MNKVFAVCASILMLVILLGVMPVHGEAEVYDSVIRLHVLANSDSADDQALKLKVRDAVLERMTDVFEENECLDINDAERVVAEHIDDIMETAERCIAEEGYSYSVDVIIKEEKYPTRNYELLAFPSGRYLSLQIKIGEADGQNWWCVLFPPLCLSAATETSVQAEDALMNIGLSGEQYKIITESENAKYNVRFKILETIDEIIS